MDWKALREECLDCRRCGLASTRTHVVFGVGSTDAEIMLIGEGPGANEDLQGEPFVGRGGAASYWTRCWRRWGFPERRTSISPTS